MGAPDDELKLKMYNLKKASKILNLSIDTLYQYIKEGKLFALKIQSVYFVTPAALMEFQALRLSKGKGYRKNRKQVLDILSQLSEDRVMGYDELDFGTDRQLITFNSAQVSYILGVHPNVVANATKDGRLRSAKIAGRHIYTQKAIVEFVELSESKGKPRGKK